MNHYRQHLQCKYESLRLTSPDEMLDCCSSQYISLTLVKAGEETKTNSRYINENERDGNVTLTEALDVESEKQNVILFEGAAGMGKSTLAINICKQWAKGDLLQGYDAVILLPLRDPEIQDAKGVGDLLLVSGEMKERVLKEITINNGERVCFIFEGYDELPQPLQKVPVFAKLTEKLPKCTLIYTSRPEACADLRTIACRTIKINGFTEQSVDDYITQVFNDIKDGGKETASRLKSQLHNKPHIKGILRIPINVAILCLVFFHFSVLPDTLTQLYTLLCLRLILRHISTRTSNMAQITKLDSLDNLPEDVSKQFDDLCLIAYAGIEKRTIIFSAKFLSDRGIVVDKLHGLGMLLITPTTSVYGREKTYNFLHFTLQEFCAARHVSKNLSPDAQKKALKFDMSYMTHYADTVLYMFYSGITGLKDKENVDCIVPHGRELIGWAVIDLINCAYEAHSVEACQMVGDILDGIINIPHCGWCIFKIQFIYFLFTLQRPINLLDISMSSFDDDIFILMLSLLEKRLSTRIDTNFTLKATDCLITQKSFTQLTTLLSRGFPVAELCIGKEVNLLSTQVKHRIKSSSKISCNLPVVADVFPLLYAFTSSETLRVLNVSGLNLGPEGAAYLAGCKGMVLHDLNISGCELGPTGADKIGEMVCYNKSIASVNLAYNKIGNSGVKNLVYHLKAHTNGVKILNLEGNNISAIGIHYLINLININSPILNSIELSHNPLQDKGVHDILQAFIIIMDHIGLISVEMTSSSIPYIAVALHKVKSIGFTLPCHTDYQKIMDGLAETKVLCCLELHLWGGFKPKYKTMNVYFEDHGCQWNPHLVSSIRKAYLNDEIQSPMPLPQRLWYGTSSMDGTSIVRVKLDIDYYKNLTLPKDLPLVEFDSSPWFIHIRPVNFQEPDKALALLILLQLRQQTFSLKKLSFRMSYRFQTDFSFKGRVDECVEQINSIRKQQEVANPLLVNFIKEGKHVSNITVKELFYNCCIILYRFKD